MPQYLQKRRQGWYAVLEVPRSLRSKMGKARFIQSLQTDSLKVAEVRKHDLVGRWKAEIQAAQGSSTTLDKVVLARRKMAAKVKPDPTEIMMLLTPQTDQEWSELEAGRKDLSAVLHGKKFPLKYHLADYEKTLSHIEAKSKDMRLSDIRRFLKKFKYAEDATNRDVKEWVEVNLIAEEGLSVGTCRRIMSNLRQYWKYLTDRKDLSVLEPFKYVVPERTISRKQEVATRRKDIEADDYRTLHKAAEAKDDLQLANLIKLGAYTGCRIEELCSIKLDKVLPDRLLIEDSKTEAGWRIIPLHDDIVGLVGDMKKNSQDDYLISGLSFNKYGDRSNAIGKRFGKLKIKCGFGGNIVFHSLRKGVATQFQRLGIAENIAANLLGHDIPTMTYGLYSGNRLDFQVLKGTINKLRWC